MKALRVGLIIAIIIAGVLMIRVGVSGQATAEITIYVDGEKVELDTSPVIVNNRTLIPLRGVFEKLGAEVDYNQETKQVIVKNDVIEVLLETSNDKVLVNGRISALDAASMIVDDRTLVPLRFVAESLGHEVKWNGVTRQIDILTGEGTLTQTDTLPSVGSFDNLAQLLKYNNALGSYITGRGDVWLETTVDAVEFTEEASDAEMEKSEESAAMATDDASGTNTQVEGVDEGDILKTDGNYIYYVKGSEVLVIDKNPEAPEIVATIEVPSARGRISEVYINDGQLVVLGSSWAVYGYPEEVFITEKSYFPPTYNTENTFLLVYDMSDIASPEVVMDMDFEGSYKTSRLADGNLYMIANRYMNYWEIDQWFINDKDVDDKLKELYEYQITPKYANNLTGEIETIDLSEVLYFPDYVQANYLMTVGIDLSTEQVDVDAYLGMADTVYATAEDLFLGFTHYEYAQKHNTLLYVPEYTYYTSLYRFELDNGVIDYVNKGKVPGTVLNQFSLDYHNNHLRVATSTGEQWITDTEQTNNVYILDDAMELVGSIEGLAPGERIYSTRFHKDRIYMVTFRQVDPFFVIDASEPTDPEVLGYLKIPGFSTYMHILDENHVLGFGKDTVEEEDFVRTGGFKISLFDVTDTANPIEEKKEVIGVSGTYSELDYNHKALMISLGKGVMGFPISVASKTPYSTDFIGAYVYDLSTDNFEYRGNVSHQTEVTSDYYYYNNDAIKRLMYIGDYLYTLSDDKMMVHTLDTIEKVSELDLPGDDTVKDYPEIMPVEPEIMPLEED